MSSALSTERLARWRARLAGHVERGAVPGVVALLTRRDDTHVEAIGAQQVGGAPMRRDTIFRITSMTKPVTAAAAMILIEEGKLRLDEPVDRLLPPTAACLPGSMHRSAKPSRRGAQSPCGIC